MQSLPKSFAKAEVSDQPDPRRRRLVAATATALLTQLTVNSTNAAESLDLLDHHFESTFLRAGVGLAHVDLQGRFLRVNPLFCQILGYSSDQLRQMTFMQISEPDFVARDWPALQEIFLGSRDNYTREKLTSARMVRASGATSAFPCCLRPTPHAIASWSPSMRFRSASRPRKIWPAPTNFSTFPRPPAAPAASNGTSPTIHSSGVTTTPSFSVSGFPISIAPLLLAQARRSPADAAQVDAELQAAFAAKRPKNGFPSIRSFAPITAKNAGSLARAKIFYDRQGQPVSHGRRLHRHHRPQTRRAGIGCIAAKDLEHHVHQRTAELVQKTLEMAEQARQIDEAN